MGGSKPTVTPSGHFVVVDGLHLDAEVFQALERWSVAHGHSLQDAVQMAVCFLLERQERRRLAEREDSSATVRCSEPRL